MLARNSLAGGMNVRPIRCADNVDIAAHCSSNVAVRPRRAECWRMLSSVCQCAIRPRGMEVGGIGGGIRKACEKMLPICSHYLGLCDSAPGTIHIFFL